MNKIYKPTLPHLVRTYTTWPFRGILHSYIEHVYMYKQASASGHGQWCTFTCSCMAIIITGKNTMTRSRSVRHIIKHRQIQDFFFLRPCRFSKLILFQSRCNTTYTLYIYTHKYCLDVFGYIKWVYIYVYNYIYMIVY